MSAAFSSHSQPCSLALCHPLCLLVTVICWWHLPSMQCELWHLAQYLPAHPDSCLHPGNFNTHCTIQILGYSLLQSPSPMAAGHRNVAPPSIWPSPQISSPQKPWTQKSHFLIGTCYPYICSTSFLHLICFLTLFRPLVLGPVLI